MSMSTTMSKWKCSAEFYSKFSGIILFYVHLGFASVPLFSDLNNSILQKKKKKKTSLDSVAHLFKAPQDWWQVS